MNKIALSGGRGKGKFALVDDDKFKGLNTWKWYLSKRGYPEHTIHLFYWDNRKAATIKVKMHQLILPIKPGKEVDHKDTDKLNNQRDNLRLLSHANNLLNQSKRSDNTSGFKGVSWNKLNKKWVAYINYEKRRISLGYFSTKEKARDAYNEASLRLHGEFGSIND